MGEDPGEIREEIEATRDRMSETADALVYKVDVPARAKERVAGKKDELLGRVRSAAPANRQQAVEQLTAGRDRLVGKARDVARDPRQARRQSLDSAKRATIAVRRRPRALAVAAGLAALLGVKAFRRARRSSRASMDEPQIRHGREGAGAE